ncbi:unnamed protein product [Gordionus sp. m RMFG-2023]|uniref:RING-type E3 ubiquitin-protein ligase PPIL2-like isoform X1 n=1 Tax=Gordionus sp. m RMFG-2023 TaxID=3053472 RepID=UPI0030E46944
MGKKQHQKDKLYLTTTEWVSIYGGKRTRANLDAGRDAALAASQNILPLDFCALTLSPFTFPVSTLEGYVFDFMAIMELFKKAKKQVKSSMEKKKEEDSSGELSNKLGEKVAQNLPEARINKRHKQDPTKLASSDQSQTDANLGLVLRNPVTGTVIKDVSKEIFPLKFHRNNAGELHCPVTFRVLNDRSRVVAIRSTGNVFSGEAVEDLNLKTKHYKDLLTDEPFVPSKDLVVLRDPKTVARKLNIGIFKHVLAARHARHFEAGSEESSSSISEIGQKTIEKDDSRKIRTLNRICPEMEAVMSELAEWSSENLIAKGSNSLKVAENDDSIITYAHYSKGNVAIGLTCSTLPPQTMQVMEILDSDIVRYSKIKTKGYAQIVTNLGNLNIELHCDAAPRMCENFLILARKDFYDNLLFFRSIKHFMIQTGDPNLMQGQPINYKDKNPLKPRNYSHTGSYLPDEFALASNYRHSGRGIVSAANLGRPDTNGSQFFITFRSRPAFDKVHTVFARVVGGMSTLDAFERVETDERDAPVQEIYIKKVVIFSDPFQDFKEKEDKEKEERGANKLEQENKRKADEGLKADSVNVKRNSKIVSSNEKNNNIGKYLNLKKN